VEWLLQDWLLTAISMLCLNSGLAGNSFLTGETPALVDIVVVVGPGLGYFNER